MTRSPIKTVFIWILFGIYSTGSSGKDFYLLADTSVQHHKTSAGSASNSAHNYSFSIGAGLNNLFFDDFRADLRFGQHSEYDALTTITSFDGNVSHKQTVSLKNNTLALTIHYPLMRFNDSWQWDIKAAIQYNNYNLFWRIEEFNGANVISRQITDDDGNNNSFLLGMNIVYQYSPEWQIVTGLSYHNFDASLMRSRIESNVLQWHVTIRYDL